MNTVLDFIDNKEELYKTEANRPRLDPYRVQQPMINDCDQQLGDDTFDELLIKSTEHRSKSWNILPCA